jgi:hypothetical protein
MSDVSDTLNTSPQTVQWMRVEMEAEAANLGFSAL